MTQDDNRYIDETIESANPCRPTIHRVPAYVYNRFCHAYDRLNAECAELQSKNERLEDQATVQYCMKMEREVRRARRFMWMVIAGAVIVVGACVYWGLR